MTDEASQSDSSTPVQLARIEGKIDLIKYQGETFAKDLTVVKTDVAKLKTDVHTLQLEAASRDTTAKTIADTLKNREEEDSNSRSISAAKWTPLNRLYLISGTIYGVVSLWYITHK